MVKVTLSISLDDAVVAALDKENKSDKINQILKHRLCTKERIEKEIAYHQRQIEILQQKIRLLELNEQKTIEEIPTHIKEKLPQIKKIIDERPDRINIWVDILNKNYEVLIDASILKKMIKRWC